MSLTYKGVQLHDAGCSCCALSFSDAKNRLSTRDPTGTSTIRRAMASAMTIKLNSLRPLLRTHLLQNDILGLNISSMASAMLAAQSTAGGSVKVDVFQRLFDNLVLNTFLEGQGEYISKYIAAAYAKGSSFGYTQVGLPQISAIHLQVNDRVNTLVKFTFVEMQGVAEAMSQQAVRVVANGLLAKQPIRRIMRSVFAVISKVGIERARTITEFMVVRSFNEASLDAYADAGITQVNLIPETQASPTVTDARKTGAGSRVSRKRTPSGSTISRITKAEERLNRMKLVRVRTAGDDRVCIICEDIADDGPYTIDTARSLIPAHPRCRCVLVPARDRRFAPDSMSYRFGGLLKDVAKPGDIHFANARFSRLSDDGKTWIEIGGVTAKD